MGQGGNSWGVVLGGVALLALAAVLYCLYQWALGPRWVPAGRLRAIYLYPLKSGAPTLVPYARCHYIGLCYKNLTDRMFVVYDEEHKVVTARTAPNLLRIKVLPSPLPDRVRFTTTSGRDFFEVDLSSISMETSTISMKFPTTDTEILHTRDCGDDAAAWISLELERSGVRLGFWPSGFGRDIVKARSREVGVFDISNNIAGAYSNMSSFLLLNYSSVEDLSGRLGPDSTVGAHNFRGNILIEGAKPYAEDRWQKLKIGTTIFRVVKPCVRCMLVTIDPKTLEKDPNMEPLRTLKTYRQLTNPEERNIEGDSPVMGSYMGLVNSGLITVGDPVYALSIHPREAIFNMLQYF